MSEIIQRSITGHVARITLNRPQAGNALSIDMLAQLGAALDETEADTDAKVILLCAQGHIFCAGHDLKEMTAARAQADGGKAFFSHTMTSCSEVMQKIVSCKKPVIAVVQGMATAAGCQLVASCDLALGASEAKFATPGVHIGLFCSTPMVALSRNISRKHAMQMLLTGEAVSADEAEKWGLINAHVPKDMLEEEAQRWAENIASKPASTVRIGKSAFYQQAEMSLADAYHYAAQVMTDNMMEADAEEGISAFVEKRTARWQS